MDNVYAFIQISIEKNTSSIETNSLVIVGGEGHMTENSRKVIHTAYPEIATINFASYKVRLKVLSGKLLIEPSDTWGMWDIERYISLVENRRDGSDGFKRPPEPSPLSFKPSFHF
ncbi:MAG: hypothetical protein K0S80_5154 [Neobacillus sp.]|nr:hypothetical protein [Neobacillus sp.]